MGEWLGPWYQAIIAMMVSVTRGQASALLSALLSKDLGSIS